MAACNQPNAVGLTPEHLAVAHPCHFVLDDMMQIYQYGRTLEKLIPGIRRGDLFTDHFSIKSPHVDSTIESITEQFHTVFFLHIPASSQTLRGQFLISEQPTGRLIFIGSPVVRDMDSVLAMGLALDDFAIHDAVIDMLLILQSKTNTIDDTNRMAKQLRKEVNERRTAQTELQKVNEGLELRVSQRTAQLRISNGKLKRNVIRLERHNSEMRILNKMGDMLQACRSMSETYDVIRSTMVELFNGSSGMLALYRADNDRYATTFKWGNISTGEYQFSRASCWALRRGRLQVTDFHKGAQHPESCFCKHLQSDISGFTCIPLSVQNEQIGLMQVIWPTDQKLDQPGNRQENEQELWQLVQTASDHIALAIANVQLQEQLRLQSIRDVLTGLYNRRHMEDTLHREILRAKRANTSLGIIMLDVDHFKRINDYYGHDIGDEMLRQLGIFLQRMIRGDDIACRYGGEEFIIILPGASLENTGIRAQQICQEAAHQIVVPIEGNIPKHITISVGVSSYPKFGEQPDQLIKSADKALYQAKNNGRNQVVISSPELMEQHA